MRLSETQRAELAADIAKFANELNLTDQQTEKLRAVLTDGRERLEQFRQENPNLSNEQITETIDASRTSIREQIVPLFSEEQLAKWDTAMAKAKDFLGQWAS